MQPATELEAATVAHTLTGNDDKRAQQAAIVMRILTCVETISQMIGIMVSSEEDQGEQL